MTASTNPDWVMTAGQLCEAAAQELGAIGLGDNLEASEAEKMLERLNAMLAKWSAEGNLWREETATLTIAGGAGAATLPSDVRDVRSVRHIVSATNQRVLQPWNRDEFYRLPNRAQSGASPLAFYYAQRVDADQLYVWPVPPTDQQFEIDYNRAFYQAEEPTQTLDIPREWYEAALYGLAARCANIFGATNLSPGVVQRVDAQAKAEFERMLDADRPDSYQFVWDSPVDGSTVRA